MRILRNVAVGDSYERKIALGIRDVRTPAAWIRVIGLLYLCPSLSLCTPCVSCNVKNWENWGLFWSIIGNDACFTYVRQDVQLIQR